MACLNFAVSSMGDELIRKLSCNERLRRAERQRSRSGLRPAPNAGHRKLDDSRWRSSRRFGPYEMEHKSREALLSVDLRQDSTVTLWIGTAIERRVGCPDPPSFTSGE